jgi:hypothetical protein
MGVMSQLDSDLSLLRQAAERRAPIPIKNFQRPPFAPCQDIADEFGRDLYAAHIDPSDPDDCFRFLADLYPERLKDVLAHADRAAYEAGQLYIAAEMARADDAA